MSGPGQPAQEPHDELVDHVDPNGNVLAVVTRGEMRARALRHRCTYVFVVRPSGRLVVHERADWKSIYPSHWDLAFGGICGAGEPWELAARRELAEEAGITDVVLEPLGPMRYDASDGHIVGRVYLAITDAEVRPVDGEVVAVDEIELAGATRVALLQPELLLGLEEHLIDLKTGLLGEWFELLLSPQTLFLGLFDRPLDAVGAIFGEELEEVGDPLVPLRFGIDHGPYLPF